MDKVRIIESIDKYLQNPNADYAVLIKGEWGVGKTYFLKNEIFTVIKNLKLRPIYISLIGINLENQLEKVILEKINPFYNSNNRSSASIEAEFIESIVNNNAKPDLNIPKNIVLCIDDLERVKPEYFEKAMGVINVFIEHYKTKCIFICHEKEIEENELFQNYKKNKEKYVRFTFEFNPGIESIIKEKIKNLKEDDQKFYNIPLIVNIFRRGNTNNLRTLFFILSVFQQIIDEINKLKLKIQQKQLNEIIELIQNYLCFYTIEAKRGTSFTLLDKITIANTGNLWRNILRNKEVESIDGFDFNGELLQPEVEKTTELAEIENRYFVDSSFEFEKFGSVAELIKTGYLNSELLHDEIIYLNKTLEEVEIDEANKLILGYIDNIFELSDLEVEDRFYQIIERVELGFFNLPSYIKLYRDLVWLESFSVEGINLSEEITEKFKNGAKKAAASGRFKFVYNLLFQFQWSKDDRSEYAEKFKSFATYVDQLNDSIKHSDTIIDFEEIIKALLNNDFDLIVNTPNSESNIRFLKEDAIKIYDALIKANAKTSNNFYSAIMERYANEGTTISHLLRKESGFIFSLYQLLLTDKSLFLNNPKPLSKLPIVFLKDYLKNLIEKHSITLN